MNEVVHNIFCLKASSVCACVCVWWFYLSVWSEIGTNAKQCCVISSRPRLSELSVTLGHTLRWHNFHFIFYMYMYFFSCLQQSKCYSFNDFFLSKHLQSHQHYATVSIVMFNPAFMQMWNIKTHIHHYCTQCSVTMIISIKV